MDSVSRMGKAAGKITERIRPVSYTHLDVYKRQITLQHGLLHQKQTLANGGEYCDYFITENKE